MTWVSISDRFPLLRERVWAYTKAHGTFHAYRDIGPRKSTVIKWFVHGAGGSARDEITHWMARPLPPDAPRLKHLEFRILEELEELQAMARLYGGREQIMTSPTLAQLIAALDVPPRVATTKAVDRLATLEYIQWHPDGLYLLDHGVLALQAHVPSSADIAQEAARQDAHKNKRWRTAAKKLHKKAP